MPADPGYFRACHYSLTIKSENMKSKIFGIGAFMLLTVGVLHHPSICPFHHSKSLVAHHTGTPQVKESKMILAMNK
jgi:hypothetical protein